MSRNEWEDGTLTLPVRAIPALRRALLDAWNKQHGDAFAAATGAYPVLAALPDPHGKPWSSREETPLGKWLKAEGYALDETYDTVWELLFDGVELRKPTLKQLKLREPEGLLVFDLGDAAITLDTSNRTLRWQVYENNHAVDRARAHPMAKRLFRELRALKWTRGSGGIISGNDEYNRESRDSGGGGNYVVDTFGPPRRRAAGRAYA